jgi:hypothetical protein
MIPGRQRFDVVPVEKLRREHGNVSEEIKTCQEAHNGLFAHPRSAGARAQACGISSDDRGSVVGVSLNDVSGIGVALLILRCFIKP